MQPDHRQPFKKLPLGTSAVIQWLKLGTVEAGDSGPIPG